MINSFLTEVLGFTPIEEVKTEAESPKKTFGERYKKYIGILKDGPTDLAANHDHYLYGTPKQNP